MVLLIDNRIVFRPSSQRHQKKRDMPQGRHFYKLYLLWRTKKKIRRCAFPFQSYFRTVDLHVGFLPYGKQHRRDFYPKIAGRACPPRLTPSRRSASRRSRSRRRSNRNISVTSFDHHIVRLSLPQLPQKFQLEDLSIRPFERVGYYVIS